ncbi:MAG: amidohydrolase family protein, partial [Acidobacteriota bacterium]
PDISPFIASMPPDGLMEIVTTLRRAYEDNPQVQIGVAPHSLRAVSPSMLEAIVRQVRAPDSRAPVHIHVAEQRREVEECLAWCGRRPVDWLLANAPVDESWCLVHATHMTGGEIQGLAASRAVVALCPTTEANLGDGVFPFALFHEAGGRFGIGSDSNVSVGVSEELRWLEYVQRLHGGRRLVAASRDCPSAGAALYRSALAGGRQAVARPVGRIEAGNRADWLVLDPSHAGLVGKSGDLLLDAFVFACTDNPVRDVMVGGKWVVREGAHEREEVMGAAFRDAIVELQK